MFMDSPGFAGNMLVLIHRSMSIAGTSEIRRNQIGERISACLTRSSSNGPSDERKRVRVGTQLHLDEHRGRPAGPARARARGYVAVDQALAPPAVQRTPYPAGSEMPTAYRRMDRSRAAVSSAGPRPASAQGGAAARARPPRLAKTVTTIDQLSGGRFDFGVGVGWNAEELADHRPDILGGATPSRSASPLRCEATTGGAQAMVRLRSSWADRSRSSHHLPVVGGMAGRLGTRHVVTWADR
jgi:hypothetical protein